MSILIDESYANPNQQLWASTNSVLSNLPVAFATNGFGVSTTYDIDAFSTIALTFADTGSLITGASYNCIYCFFLGNIIIRDPYVDLYPMIFTLNFASYSAGIEYVFDSTLVNNPEPSEIISISLPFIYDGSNQSISFSFTNTTRSNIQFVVSSTAEAIIETSSTPTKVPQYFIPVG